MRGPVCSRDAFHREGYVVLKAAVDPDRYIAPLNEAYSDLVDELARLVTGDEPAEPGRRLWRHQVP